MAMDKGYEEFRNDVQHITGKGKRKIPVTNSWGVYDCYKAIRKNKWFNIGRPLKEGEFYAIIRGINELLAKELVEGHTITFPEKMGKLELRKYDVGASFVNGELRITYPIDWSSTMKLWYEDAEAREQKILLRHNNKVVYRVKYCTQEANYINKAFYQFKVNFFLKRALSKRIKEGKTDTIYG